jgi:aldehyde:ferredoxin oxidoreductase
MYLVNVMNVNQPADGRYALHVADGKVLRINLSTRKVSFEPSGHRELVGGRGVNQYILFKELPLRVDAFDPRNILTIGAGLLVGTDAPAACRISIDTKSPLTGGIGSANVGGNFGFELKSAGIANIVIHGRADKLVYILIDDGDVEIKDARHLSQMTVSETEEALTRDLGEDYQKMSIGPAGENLARTSCVIVNRARSASRCGIGSVFGSKNVKAIAVRGSQEIEVSNAQKFSRLVEDCYEKMENSGFNRRRKKYGAYCYEEPWQIETPYRNFSGDIPPEEKKLKLTPDAFLKLKIGQKTCRSCPIGCWSIYRFKHENEWIVTEALQGNDIKNFGAKLDLDEPEDILYAHHLCDELGLDEDATSNVIAWAFECFEKRLINEDKTDGLKLSWGNKEAVFKLVTKIAHRDGFGDILADGCKAASERLGCGSDCCVHVKGNDLYECLWMSPSWALGVVVSPRGGTHTRGAVMEDRIRGTPEEMCRRYFGSALTGSSTSYEGKESLVVFMERLNAVLDCLGICMFTHSGTLSMLLPEHYAALLSAASGIDVQFSELMRIGERVHTLEKCFNILHTNWTRKDDLPPRRFTDRPLAGKYRISMRKWNKLLDRYYKLHGWSSDGRPTKRRLSELGLKEVYDTLSMRGV